MPTLRFTPYAWAKLLYLRDAGETEVGGFGISAEEDLFLIEDVRLVEQRCTQVTVEFDDEAVADFFDEQVDSGRQPEQFGRLWVHTHPGESAEPSGTDEETFARAFGSSSWAVMFILAKGGATYARLRFGCGPGAELLVPVAIDWDAPFPEADHADWEREYDRCVQPLRPAQSLSSEDIALMDEHPDLFDGWGSVPLDHELQDMERSAYDERDFI